MNIHWSDLRWMMKSPAHYKHNLGQPFKPTTAMEIGSIAHSLVLGGPREYLVYPGKVRRGKKFDQFKLDNANAEIVTQGEYDTARWVADSLMTDKEAMAVLLSGETEKSLQWKLNGFGCAGRLDAVSQRVVADMKVTGDAHPTKFPWHARRMGWLGQASWYEEGAIQNGYKRIERVSLVAVEPVAPFPVVVYDLSEAAIESGRALYKSMLEQLRVCTDHDMWPGYVQGISVLDVPDDEPTTVIIDGEDVDV